MDSLLNLLKGFAPSLATAVAGPLGGAAVSLIASKLGVSDTVAAVAEAISGDPEVSLKLRELELEYTKEANADRNSARVMQGVALQQEDLFSKRFIYYFAAFWSLFSAAYFMLVTFVEMPTGSRDFANIILGFLLGTALTSIFMFFYGSSKTSKDKDEVNALLSRSIR